MTKKLLILPWQIYKNLKVIEEIAPDKKFRRFKTECIKCGKISDKYMNSLFHTKTWCSCTRVCLVKHKSKYSVEEKRLYGIFGTMKQRCNNKKYPQSYLYGGKWIKCEWNTFKDFYRDMWPTYQEGLSIDRINWNWNYCKENCRWADKFTQNNNRSNNIIVEWWLTLAQWCRTKWIERIFHSPIYRFLKKWMSLEEIQEKYKKYKKKKV